jgi:hypothetical protein
MKPDKFSERTDCREKFQIASTHCLTRNLQFADDARYLRYVIEHKFFAIRSNTIVMEFQCNGAVNVVVDLSLFAAHEQPVFLPRKIVAPQTLFGTHHEIGIVRVACPDERRRRVEPDSLFAKSDLAGL